MAQVIINGEATPVKVVFIGVKLDIWQFGNQDFSYEVLYKARGSSFPVSFTEEDAEELTQQLEAIEAGLLSQETLETQIADKIEEFLLSIEN
jgi:hypothetical protein